MQQLVLSWLYGFEFEHFNEVALYIAHLCCCVYIHDFHNIALAEITEHRHLCITNVLQYVCRNIGARNVTVLLS